MVLGMLGQMLSNNKKKHQRVQKLNDKWKYSNLERAMEMFKSGEGSDCVIEVQQSEAEEKKEFNVHKYVLIANSDVFRAMFSHKNTKEFRESRVQINDSTPTAVRQMLHYMYAGELPDDYEVANDAAALVKIADKYQIKPLVEYNEKCLIDSLYLENVCDRLKLADLYQIDSLIKSCGKMIRQNLGKLKKTEKWNEFKEASPKLVISVLEQLADETEVSDEDEDSSDESDDDQ